MRIEEYNFRIGKDKFPDLLEDAVWKAGIGGYHDCLHQGPLPEILVTRFGNGNGIAIPDF